MSENNQGKVIAMGMLGAAVSGVIGYYAFFWLISQGLYALVLPGGLLGLGAGICARRRSIPLAVICCIAALLLGLYTEWRWAPFAVDRGLGYFSAHVFSLKPVTLLMVALGSFLGFRLALGRRAGTADQTET